ncbi:MAG: flagellar biosynthetic protein FliR [Candidatus Eremiobacteraeota bacterium]|nr:flagellar biosynthetic protein FliR [Candidatus Eremiobacteraeota bacterium]
MIAPQIAALALAAARGASFAATVPLAGSGAVPKIVRASLTIAIVPALAARNTAAHSYEPGTLLLAALAASLSGAAFGLAASVVFGAAEAAGGLVDGALAWPVAGFDKLSGANAGTFGKLFPLAFACAFFSSGAFTALIARFAAAASAVPQNVFSLHAALALGHCCIDAALALGGPAIFAQCLGTLLAATVARVAPKINGMFLSTPLCAGLVLVALLVGAPALMPAFLALAERSVAAASG